MLWFAGVSRDNLHCNGLRCRERSVPGVPTCGSWDNDLFIFADVCDMLWFNCVSDRSKSPRLVASQRRAALESGNFTILCYTFEKLICRAFILYILLLAFLSVNYQYYLN